MHTLGKRALQRAQCVARGLCRTGLDKVGDGLGLRQVELIVEERAFAEFTRPGQSAAQLQAALQQHIQDYRSTVALEFQHIFAGK
ncbi:hypothetical protein D3C85_1241400 [compost metagenome]